MKIKRVFDVYEDAGHAWMKVKKDLLHKMGIADKITAYSYERGEYAYLEEDCDLSTFYHRYKDMYGIDIKYPFNFHLLPFRLLCYCLLL